MPVSPFRRHPITRRTASRLLLSTLAMPALGRRWSGAAQEDPIALGVMVEVVNDRAGLDLVAGQIGRVPAIVMFHVQWGNEGGRFDRGLFDFLHERGAAPLVTWEPWNPIYAGGVAVFDQPEFALRTILNGDWDAYIDSWAEGVAAFGQPVFLRFGHEMNGNWYPWSVWTNGNTAAEFVAAWRYLVDRFAAAGADNVRWVWSPNALLSGSAAELLSLYPGDDAVHYVGISGFNWGTTVQPWGVAGWQSFAEIFTATYGLLGEMTTKPLIIAEMASAEEGGDKAAWILDAYLTQLPQHFPRIRAVTWFNIEKETDWRFSSSPASLEAFITAAEAPYFQGQLT